MGLVKLGMAAALHGGSWGLRLRIADIMSICGIQNARQTWLLSKGAFACAFSHRGMKVSGWFSTWPMWFTLPPPLLLDEAKVAIVLACLA